MILATLAFFGYVVCLVLSQVWSEGRRRYRGWSGR